MIECEKENGKLRYTAQIHKIVSENVCFVDRSRLYLKYLKRSLGKTHNNL